MIDLLQLKLALLASFKSFGLLGCAVIVLSELVAALAYTGKRQEPYSVLNHFISELGEIGVSRLARVFNGGLIAGGVLLVPFVIGLGLYLGSPWALLGILAGVWAAVSCALVGCFPMNTLTPHIRAAVSYFRSGLVMVLLFTLAILAQPDDRILIPKIADLFGVISVLAYASFLFLLGRQPVGTEATETLDPNVVQERPRFWLTPAIEWAVLFSTILWFFSIAVYI